jgi:Concanavalin A-like lectin/glucanases superfamily
MAIIPVSKLYSNGDLQITGSFDEVNYFPGSFNATGSLYATFNLPNALGTGNFTIEFWTYPLTYIPSSYGGVFDTRTSGTDAAGIALYYTSSYIKIRIGGTDYTAANYGTTLNVWNHVAVVKNSGTINLYVNGTSILSFSDSSNLSNRLMYLNRTFDSYYGSSYFNNFRVKNTAVYTSNFTPPTTPLISDSNTLVLIKSQPANPLVDVSNNNVQFTISGITYAANSSAGTTPFYLFSANSGSISFPNGTWASITPNTALQFNTNDLTIEAWVYPTAVSTGSSIFDQRATYPTYNGVYFYLLSNGAPAIRTNGNSLYSGNGAAGYVASLNTWTHVALTKTGNTFYGWVNGKQAFSQAYSNTLSDLTTIYLGRTTDNNSSYYFQGYISNLRVLNGTALYTSTFTPPTAPLPVISNTALLLNTSYGIGGANTFYDSSSNHLTLSTSGGILGSTSNPFGYTYPLYTGFSRQEVTGNFDVNGVLNDILSPPVTSFQVLAVAGGGGGGTRGGTYSAGGGAGGLVTNNYGFSTSSYTITVGNGGLGGACSTNGTNTSIVGTGINIVAIGGGHGAVGGSVQGSSGGSGGGSSCGATPKCGGAALQPTSASGGFGNPGGAGVTCFGSSSGGGAGGAGIRGCYAQKFVTGGAGYLSSITGTPTYYANGGPGVGSTCGTFTATSMGGGGAGNQTANNGGANGGVIIAYKSPSLLASGGTTSSFSNTCGTFQVHTFTTNGTFSVTSTPTATVSKTYSNGMYAAVLLDEVTNNPNTFGSLSFNGTSQYLTLPSNSAFSFGTGDFTIEFWIFAFPFTNTNGKMIVDARPTATNGAYWNFGLDNSGTGKLLLSLTNGGTSFTSTTGVATGSWHHVVATRQSGTVRMFIDGVSAMTPVTGNADNAGSSGLSIGSNAFRATATDTYFAGYISNLRIVNGTALYTANFTPPVQPLLPVTGTSLLLNTKYNNDAFIDSSNNVFTVTNINGVSSSPQTPLNPPGYYSSYYNGTSSYLTTSSLTFTSNCTVEGYFYSTTSAGGVLLTIGSEASNRVVYVANSSMLKYNVYGSSDTTFSTSVPLNQWNHFAFVRNGTTITAYLNGTSISNATLSGTIGNAGGVTIGRDNNSTSYYSGYLSNIRLSNTAVYTTNFTPSALPLLPLSNTVLLTSQSNKFIDNSTNSLTVTENGNTSIISNNIPFTINFANNGLN